MRSSKFASLFVEYYVIGPVYLPRRLMPVLHVLSHYNKRQGIEKSMPCLYFVTFFVVLQGLVKGRVHRRSPAGQP